MKRKKIQSKKKANEIEYPILDNFVFINTIVVERVDNWFYRVNFDEKVSNKLFVELFVHNDISEN